MSTEAWLTLTGIIVAVALAGAGGVFTLIGWFLSREIRANDREIQALKSRVEHNGTRLTRVETILGSRLPKHPSPNVEDTQ